MLVSQNYNCKNDLWSLGVIAYIMICGVPPFMHESTAALERAIVRDPVPFDDPVWAREVSGEGRDFVRRLLEKNPALRMEDPAGGGGGNRSAFAQGGIRAGENLPLWAGAVDAVWRHPWLA